VFASSYHTLSAAAARLFRLLGLVPGPDLSAPAAASLAGLPPERIGPLLAELTRAHLVTEPTGGRYTFHDLLRAYARELSDTHDAAAEREAAIHRLLDHYVHTALTGALLDPHRDPISVAPARPGVTPETLTDHREATAWLAAEHAVLLAAIRLTVHRGLDRYTWPLAWGLANFLYRQGHWHDLVTTQEAALAAARRSADGAGQGSAHRLLGYTLTRLARYDEAYEHLQQAVQVHRELGDHRGLGNAYTAIAEAWFERQGRYQEALEHAQEAFRLHVLAGSEAGQATALNQVGWYHSQLGHHEQALVCCEEALALHQKRDNRHGQAATWDSLGHAHHHLGHPAQAVDCYQRALELFRDLRDRYFEAEVLSHLGDAHHGTGDLDAARTCWSRSLDILETLEHPDAPSVRAKLAGLGEPGADRG
jgi:tetratricopeptide (TPR) repeat protein